MEQVMFEEFRPEKSDDWCWSFKDYPKEKNGIKVFSCFACGGGSTMGYKLAGCEVIGDLEIDPKMNEVYVKNHHPKYNYLMDIRDFNKKDDLPKELYNLDILDGSPPCTTFSMAGDREESWGKKKKFREGQKEQTLDDLSFVFIETVEKLKPKMVIMENVEGLMLGEARTYMHRIYKQFKDIGYNLHHYLLKGEQMGVPQTRHRVFFIAVRNDIEFDFDRLDMGFNYEPVLYETIREGEFRKLDENSKYYNLMKMAIDSDKNIADMLERLGQKPSGFQSIYCREGMVLPTIRASANLLDLKELTYINGQIIINAQTFPQDYDFVRYTTANINYICGMSVPPLMIKRIVNRIIDTGVFDK